MADRTRPLDPPRPLSPPRPPRQPRRKHPITPNPSAHKNPLSAPRAGPQPGLEGQRRRHSPRAPPRKRRPLASLRRRHARALRLLRRTLRTPRSLTDPAHAKPARSARDRHADVQPGTRRRMDRQSANRSAHPHSRALRLRTGRQRTTRQHPVLARPAGRPAQSHLPDQFDRSVANRPQPSRRRRRRRCRRRAHRHGKATVLPTHACHARRRSSPSGSRCRCPARQASA